MIPKMTNPPDDYFAQFDDETSAPPPPPKSNPARKKLRKLNQVADGKTSVVFRDHDLHATVGTLAALLPTLRNAYSMAGKLVQIEEDGEIQCLEDASLLLQLTEHHAFLREKNDGQVFPKLPSERATKALLGNGSWPGIREVRLVRSAPCLLPSGVVNLGGFGEAVLVLGNHAMAIPEVPTQQDATAAAAMLLEVVKDFPLTTEGRATWLALVLTLASRPAVLGNVPMFGIDGNSPGVGKTLLVELACMIATGQGPSVMSRPRDQVEGKKAYFTALSSGALCTLLDNIKGEPLSDETLEAILTSGSITDRILGTQQQRTVLSQAVFAATGNGLRLSTDLARRSLVIRLKSPFERPEDRELPDIRTAVAKRKAELLGAALTILRAWLVAGKKAEQTWGSFEKWAELVDGALVFAGQPSPVVSRRSYRDESDDGREALGAFLGLLEREYPDGATAAKLVADYPWQSRPEDTEKAEQGRAILEAIAEPRYSTKSLGYKLRSLLGRSVEGWELRSKVNRLNAKVYSAFFPG
jgi:putative DNA primase/helicase